jgi:hypothetical protein
MSTDVLGQFSFHCLNPFEFWKGNLETDIYKNVESQEAETFWKGSSVCAATVSVHTVVLPPVFSTDFDAVIYVPFILFFFLWCDE